MENDVTSICTTDKIPRPLPPDRSSAQKRAVENRRLVIIAALLALLLIGEAAVVVHAARTIPEFLINYHPVP
jgi:hypothetical protein